MARILLLHAEDVVIRQVRQVLEAEGYEVHVARDGMAGLVAVDSQRPDLLITDIGLPRLDGFTVLGALRAREDTRDIPVIFLSPVASPEAMLHGVAAGGRYYLTVPVDREELVFKVRRLVDP